jgi:uncharacterized BrkB/YihY/UPF0761 family membrane protein
VNVDDDNPFARRPLWQRHARVLAFAVVTSLALVLALRGVVGRGDVLAALLVERSASLALGVVVLFSARAFLLLFAPGWALFTALLFFLQRRERLAHERLRARDIPRAESP